MLVLRLECNRLLLVVTTSSSVFREIFQSAHCIVVHCLINSSVHHGSLSVSLDRNQHPIVTRPYEVHLAQEMHKEAHVVK